MFQDSEHFDLSFLVHSKPVRWKRNVKLPCKWKLTSASNMCTERIQCFAVPRTINAEHFVDGNNSLTVSKKDRMEKKLPSTLHRLHLNRIHRRSARTVHVWVLLQYKHRPCFNLVKCAQFQMICLGMIITGWNTDRIGKQAIQRVREQRQTVGKRVAGKLEYMLKTIDWVHLENMWSVTFI